MTERRFLVWTRETISGFVEQQVGAAAISERAARRYAEREFDSLLPQGMLTPGHHIWSAYDGDTEVGYLWLGVHELVEGYVYDVAVSPDLRNRGYGRALMLAGEREARVLGIGALRLNVFGQNTVARRLYERLGYACEETYLARRLDMTVPLASNGAPTVRLEPITEEQFAAYDGDTEVGMVRLSTLERSDGRHGLARDLSVHEQWRHCGYGRAILVGVEQECRDRGVVSVEVNLGGQDHGARSAYEQMGFTVIATRMGKDLIDPRHASPEAEAHPA